MILGHVLARLEFGGCFCRFAFTHNLCPQLSFIRQAEFRKQVRISFGRGSGQDPVTTGWNITHGKTAVAFCERGEVTQDVFAFLRLRGAS